MGTSKGYIPPPDWQYFKGSITRRARDWSPGTSSAAKVVSDYIHSNGGPRRIARTGGVIGGGAATTAAQNLGGFLSLVANVGLHETVRQLGLPSLEGKSTLELTHSLIEALRTPGSTIDEVDANRALGRVIDDLLKDAESVEDVETVLDAALDAAGLAGVLESFFGFYLFEQFMRVFYENLVHKVGQERTDAMLQDILDYIRARLKQPVSNRDVTGIDWAGNEGRTMAQRIHQDVLEVFGGA